MPQLGTCPPGGASPDTEGYGAAPGGGYAAAVGERYAYPLGEG